MNTLILWGSSDCTRLPLTFKHPDLGENALTPLPVPETSRILALIYLCVCFKSTWYLTEMFCICALRDMQWPTTLHWLGLDHRNTPLQMKPGGVHSYLCFLTMLSSPPQVRICTLRGTISALCKETWKTAHVPAAHSPTLEIFAPFLEPWRHACLLNLKITLLPSLQREGAFRAGALPSPFIDQWIKFLLSFIEPGFLWLAFAIPGKGPTEGSLTHWG